MTTRPPWRCTLLGLGGSGLILALVLFSLWNIESVAPSASPATRQRPSRQATPMLGSVWDLEIELGRRDQQPTTWQGRVQLASGTLLEAQVFQGAQAKPLTDEGRFTVRSVFPAKAKKGGKKAALLLPRLHLVVAGAEQARLVLETQAGKLDLPLKELPLDTPQEHLQGQVAVTAYIGGLRLPGPQTEDDFPALARGPDGTLWLASLEYLPGPPPVKEHLLAGRFEELVPQGNGDLVLLRRGDGRTWSAAMPVSEENIDAWRPTVAVDQKGTVYVVWSQQVSGNWDLYSRCYQPTTGTWGPIHRLTKTPGSDFHVVAATDAAGTVWLAWQSWQEGHFVIQAAPLRPSGELARAPVTVSDSPANNWSPAITADRQGRVYIAWDTYDRGNYDVRLVVLEGRTGQVQQGPLAVAESARFEARPSLVCDAADRLWIAYEEGDEQWGKDYAHFQIKNIGLEKNPGAPLYLNRTVRVKCWEQGKWLQPVGDLQAALERSAASGAAPPVNPDLRTGPKRNHSLPQLVTDARGGVWLFYRQHPLPSRQGEVWNTYAVRHNGRDWSAPRRLPASAHLLDNRAALVGYGSGVLAVYSGDARTRTAQRQQADLFVSLLPAGEEVVERRFVPDTPAGPAQKPPVHPQEAAQVAQLRQFRLKVQDQNWRLLRGEFHRHTEYSAHVDGDGLLEDAWRYALDAAALDWMGNGDHDNGFGDEYMWWRIQKMTDLMHHPPHFVAVHSYERSVVYPNGHRNVILPKRGIRPLPRGNLQGSPERGSPDTHLLYAYLKHFGGICASHTSATEMGTDWRDNDPEVEPVVEIYQGHRHNYEHPGAPRSPTKETQIGGFRPAGFVWNALEKGYRLGFESSSDHVSTHMSYAILLTPEASRSGILQAFKQRHSYAATDNILLLVRSGSHLMGEAFETAQLPTLEIQAQGTTPIARLHIIRNNRYVYSTEPKKQEVTLRFTDMQAQAGQTYYYYVRLEQADGNLAWASPMWITYRPR
jgi:hypothetical protein